MTNKKTNGKAKLDYSERVVVITGASSGIGRQVALDFAARGAKLVLSARRKDKLEEVAELCRAAGATVEAMIGDVGERVFVESMVARALNRFSRLDILINNAGISKHKQIYNVTPEEVDYVMRVNFMAPAYATLAALPAMMKRGEGYIVNIASVAGKLAAPRESVYAASKFALTGFTEGLWLDLAGSNIHAGVLIVGPVDTEIWQKTDEPTAYKGKRISASLISRAVFDCIENKKHEIWVPKTLQFAWYLRVAAPSVFRAGANRFDPVPKEVIERNRGR